MSWIDLPAWRIVLKMKSGARWTTIGYGRNSIEAEHNAVEFTESHHGPVDYCMVVQKVAPGRPKLLTEYDDPRGGY